MCDTRLDQGQTAEIESDVVAALAALGAAQPVASTVVRNEGPRTLFGKRAHEDDANAEFPHPVLDGESGLPETIIKAGGLPAMFGAPKRTSSAPAVEPSEEGEGTFFGIGSAAVDDSLGEMTAFGVGGGDSNLGSKGSSVPDWIAGLEEELRNSDEFDRFVGPGPSSSALGAANRGGGMRETPDAAPTAPIDRFLLADQTDPGIPGDARVDPTVMLRGRPAPFGALASDDGPVGEGAGVLKRKGRSGSKKPGGPASAARPSRDIRFESPPPQDAALGDTFAAPVSGPSPRAPDRSKPLEFADTGAIDAVSQPRPAPQSGRSAKQPAPAKTPAPPRGPTPVPRTPGATAPDAAWDVFVPSAADLARTDLTTGAEAATEQFVDEDDGGLAEVPAQKVRPPISASRIVATVAIVVAVVCLAFGAFLVWLVDRG